MQRHDHKIIQVREKNKLPQLAEIHLGDHQCSWLTCGWKQAFVTQVVACLVLRQTCHHAYAAYARHKYILCTYFTFNVTLVRTRVMHQEKPCFTPRIGGSTIISAAAACMWFDIVCLQVIIVIVLVQVIVIVISTAPLACGLISSAYCLSRFDWPETGIHSSDI